MHENRCWRPLTKPSSPCTDLKTIYKQGAGPFCCKPLKKLWLQRENPLLFQTICCVAVTISRAGPFQFCTYCNTKSVRDERLTTFMLVWCSFIHLAFVNFLPSSVLYPYIFGPADTNSTMWSLGSSSLVSSPKKSPRGGTQSPGLLTKMIESISSYRTLSDILSMTE